VAGADAGDGHRREHRSTTNWKSITSRVDYVWGRQLGDYTINR